MIPISVLRTFKITGRKNVYEELLFKVIKGISAFCILFHNHITWISVFRKEALLRSSGNSLLTLCLLGFSRPVVYYGGVSTDPIHFH